ncbi:hypothetical protein [Microbacterium sp. NPDC055599]
MGHPDFDPDADWAGSMDSSDSSGGYLYAAQTTQDMLSEGLTASGQPRVHRVLAEDIDSAQNRRARLQESGE